MQKIKRFILKHTWALLLVSCLIFIPQSFSYQAKLNMRVIVTGMAVDKVEEGYEITAQVVMPSPGSESGGGSATLGFISEQGANISEGIQKIAYKIGKTAGLSHMSFLIVGQSMLSENLAETLDYFIRDPEINTSVMVLVSPESGKDMLKKTETLELSAAVGLQKVFIYKQSSFNGIMMPIEEFINNSFSISKTSTISGIYITNEGEEKLGENTDASISESKEGQTQGGQSGSQSGGENNGSSNANASPSTPNNQQGRIKYYNDVYYFKKGKYIGKLDTEEELLGYFVTDKVSNNGELIIRNVNGSVLKNATVGLQFREEKSKRKVEFEEGRPVCTFKIQIKDVQIVEVLNQGQISEKIYHDPDDQMIKAIKDAVKNTIETNIMKTFEKTKSDDVDIFKIADSFYQYKPKQWKEFYSEYGEAYLDEITVKVQVEIKNIN